jgi:hypothetical protein
VCVVSWSQYDLRRHRSLKKGKLARGRQALQRTLHKLQWRVRQGRAGVIDTFKKSHRGVKSMGRRVVKGMRSTFGRQRREPAALDDGYAADNADAGANPDFGVVLSQSQARTADAAAAHAGAGAGARAGDAAFLTSRWSAGSHSLSSADELDYRA